MTTPVLSDSADALRRQAIAWRIGQCGANWTADDQVAFEAWLRLSPAHAAAYAEISRRLNWLERLAASDTVSRDAALRYRPVMSKSGLGRWTKLATAAVVLLGLGVATFSSQGWYGRSSHYVVQRGGHQTLSLADGSVLELNTDSEIQVRLNHWQRRVEVIKGEVFFKVVHQPERPFLVMAGAGRSVDIGTEFNVYRQAGQVLVAVQEGRVRVDARQSRDLSAGQVAAYDDNGEFVALPAGLSVDNVTAWRRGKLVFNNRRLDEVLAEIGRYHQVRLQLSEHKLADNKVSGAFFIDRLEDNLATIAGSLNLKVVHALNGEVSLARR